ncbi:MAG: carbamoyltransferase N-terminal domain-containing protein [Lentisphaeria bacterium]|nr:carbamoyltransferase N-terminal domain-containing protein [Lentisphaeria bacterium]
MNYILGISAFFHDSAAALLRDGKPVAAAQEERFTRTKHDASFPRNAITFCLRQADIAPTDLAAVAFYEKPLVKFHRLMETYAAVAPRGCASFRAAMPQWIQTKLNIPRLISRGLPGYDGAVLFPEHHESHAAAAFFPSPFAKAAIVTIDGVGEWTTTSIAVGHDNRIEFLQRIRFPHSLGLLYSAFTYYLGFQVNSGEYKVMGLAPYGDSSQAEKYARLIQDSLIDIRPDGSFRMDMSFFNYCQGLTMTNEKFNRLFGAPPRKSDQPLTQRDMDLAAAVQLVTERIMLQIARHARQLTGVNNLCMAGGVALNCVGNGLILREKIFDRCFFQPAAGDAGGALGAALTVWHHVMEQPRTADETHDTQKGSLLGPRFTNDDIETFARKAGATYRRFDAEDDLLARVADLLAEGKVVGHFHGPMEFGPRALGARSILGDSRNPGMQSTMNLKIKFRESFRPFAPIVLEEDCQAYFDLSQPSPYMLRVGHVRPERRKEEDSSDLWGIDRLNQPQSDIPAVTHVDYSARVQTVDNERDPRLHRLLQIFKEKTGCSVLVNTSFNIRGEPIVCTPADAYRCFMGTEMDGLVMENCLFLKAEQPSAEGTVGGADYVDHFQQADTVAVPDTHTFRGVRELWRDPPSKTRSFGWIFLSGMTLIGALRIVLHGGMNLSGGLARLNPALPWWGIGVVVGLAAALAPKQFRFLYVTWMLMGQIIGKVVMQVILMLVYFCILTPIGLLYRRWTGPLAGKLRPNGSSTYWESYQCGNADEDYYRTY